MKHTLPVLLLLLWMFSCTEYTPKPRGYFRIEPAEAEYLFFSSDTLPFQFNLSRQAIVAASSDTSRGWINIVYPELNATIYCSYLPITPVGYATVESENRRLLQRLINPTLKITEKAYSHPEADVFGSLFILDGETSSPLQFLLTDSVRHFFRGALYIDSRPNADSLAPVVDYLQRDIIEMIQSFNWKK